MNLPDSFVSKLREALGAEYVRSDRASLDAYAADALLIAHAPDFVGGSPAGALSISEGAVLAIVVSVAYASGMGLAR